MKRILVGLCAVMMLIGMAACQREPQSASSSGTEISSQTSLPDTSAATETASTLSQTESARRKHRLLREQSHQPDQGPGDHDLQGPHNHNYKGCLPGAQPVSGHAALYAGGIGTAHHE